MSVTRFVILAGLSVLALGGGFAAWRTLRPSVSPPASIAITRFIAIDHSEAEEGLALSLAENLRTALTATGKVDVRDAQPAPPENRAATARSISAEAFLTGTVHITGAGVQSVVSLIRSRDDATIWTGTFNGTVANWFPVEDRAASELLSVLWRELPYVQHHTSDPVADQLYWRARFALYEGTPDAFRAAGELFRKAATRDPADALAWAGLADASLLLSGYDTVPIRDSASIVRAGARRAIELDPAIAEPHTSLGLVAENFDWDWPEAEHDFKRAISLDPKNAPAHHRYGEFLVLTGHVEAGLTELGKAEHIEPLSPLIESDYARSLYLARRYDEAIVKAQKALAFAPNAVPPHQWLAAAYLQKGMRTEFTQETARASVAATPFSMAVRASIAGDKQKALGFLEDSFARHETALIVLKMDPVFDTLRTEPRFTTLLNRLRLSE